MIKKTGSSINAVAMILFFVFSKLIFNLLKNFAKARQQATLANSLGCIRIKPKSNQDLAPFTSIPKNKTPIRLSNESK